MAQAQKTTSETRCVFLSEVVITHPVVSTMEVPGI